MTRCCPPQSLDLTGRRIPLLIWGVPNLMLVAGIFTPSPARTVLWTLALAGAGTACLVNASRCGRRHCFIIGPLFLLGAAASLAQGTGWLPLGAHGWVWLGATLVGGTMLSFLPEWLNGKYATPKQPIS